LIFSVFAHPKLIHPGHPQNVHNRWQRDRTHLLRIPAAVQHFPKFFPKNFSGTFTINLSGTRDERTVRDSLKMPHRFCRQVPASNPNLMQPTLNPSPYWPYYI